jgi:AAA+ superfamily predicted ATPase
LVGGDQMEFLQEVPPLMKELAARRDVQLGCALLAAAGIAAWGAYKLQAVRTGKSGAQLSPVYNSKQGLTPQEACLEKDFINKDGLCMTFDDVGGLEDQIREIEDLVLLPLSHAHLFRHSRVAQQPTGILLYGPPGTGKTMLAKAIATSAKASFLTVNVASGARSTRY